jgi:hypothetical protein
MTNLAPSSILFSHSKIRSRFTGCGKTLEQTYQEIKSGFISGIFLSGVSTRVRIDLCLMNLVLPP